MLTSFCLQLSGGSLLALLCLRSGQVHARFFRIHLLIALGLLVGGALTAPETVSELFWPLVGFAGAGCLVGYGIWWLEGAPGGKVCIFSAAIAQLTALGFGPNGFQLVGSAADAAAALLLGAALTAMLLGHWYLIAPGMSIDPLLTLLRYYFVALGARIAVSGFQILSSIDDIPWNRATWLYIGLRIASGFIGAAALGWMALQTAKIRSTQSATGILYVVVVFVFMGELTELVMYNN